jgi:hypothetical protein
VEKEFEPQEKPSDEPDFVKEVDDFLTDAQKKVEEAIAEWNRKHPNARIQ